MTQIPPEYLLAMAEQISFLSSFLGGFSATVFVTLLTLAKPGRAARLAIGLSALAAVSFIMAVVATTTLIFTLHPAAPASVADNPVEALRLQMAGFFLLGIVGLLGAIGASGWIRSKGLGVITTIMASLGMIFSIAPMT